MNKYILYALSLLFLAVACTSDFEDTNTNPNNPDSAPLINVFAYVIEDLSSRYNVTEMQYPGAFVGHITKGTYTDVINYTTEPGTGTWDGIYSTTLTNVNYVIAGAQTEGNDNLLAAAMVLKAYAMQLAVDIYGKVPYTEAGMGSEGIVHPAYDDEETIYTDLLSQLETANSLFSVSGGDISSGDLVYGGDISKWQKFCNSLRLRVAIRLTEVAGTTAQSQIATILGNPTTYPVLASNDDNALITYPGGDWVEPWTSEHSSIGDDFIAKPIVDTLLSFTDPRIEYYAEPMSDGTFAGLPVGTDADHEYSRINDQFVNNPTGNVYFMKYAEVELIKAEAIARGYVSGDAGQAYEEAITSSCKEYDIDDATISTYLAGSKVTWANSLQQIYIQKWIVLFRQSWEAWAEMRRTDVPTLAPATHSSYAGHNRPPFRFPYPDSEVKLNSDNIPTSVTETDHFWGYHVWWDTRSNVQ